MQVRQPQQVPPPREWIGKRNDRLLFTLDQVSQIVRGLGQDRFVVGGVLVPA